MMTGRGVGPQNTRGRARNDNYTSRDTRQSEDLTDYPNFRRTKGLLTDADCEVISARAVKLYCHVTILSQWSKIIAEHYQSRDTSRRAVIDLQEIEESNLTEMLMVIYPPNKPVSEWNVWKLLPLAEQLQMDALLLKCEEFLLTRGPAVKLLVTGQKYKLERLVEKQLQKLRHVSIRKIENDKMFTGIDPTIMNNLLAGRIGVLEKRHQDNGEKGQQNNEKTEMLTKIFEDVRSAWLYQGSNAKYYRKDRLQQADEDLDRLLGGTGSKLSYGTGGRYSSSTDSDAGEISYRTAQHVGTQRKGNSKQKYDKPYQPLQAPPRSDRTTTSDDSGDANKHPPKKQKKKKAAPIERTFVDDDLKEEELSADGEDGRNEDQARRDDTKLEQEGRAAIKNAKEDDVEEKTQLDDKDEEENREQEMEHVDNELRVKEPMEDDGSVTENGTKNDDPLKEKDMKTDENNQEDNNTVEAKDEKSAEKQMKNNDEATKKADDYEDDFFDDDEEL